MAASLRIWRAVMPGEAGVVKLRLEGMRLKGKLKPCGFMLWAQQSQGRDPSSRKDTESLDRREQS